MKKNEEVTNLLINSRLKSAVNSAQSQISATVSVSSLLQCINKELIVLLFILLSVAVQAATLTVASTAGGLSAAITAAGGDLTTVTDLTVTGTIDASDFVVLRDQMPALQVLNLTSSRVLAYSGTSGTNSTTTTYAVDELPEYSFSNSTTGVGKVALNTISLPSSITAIRRGAFSNCSGLNGSLAIPTGVKVIGAGAFYKCKKLSGKLMLPAVLTTIEANAFLGCSLLNGQLVLPATLTTLGTSAFQDCIGFTDGLVIPGSLKTVGISAFQGCTGMTSLVISSGVTYIGNSAFSGCTKLSGTLTIPSTVTTLQDAAFSGCVGFTGSVPFPGSSIKTIPNNLFLGCNGFTGDLIIPAWITSIGIGSFQGCSGLTGTLNLSKVTSIGDGAFLGCSGFTGVLAIPSGVSAIPTLAFQGCTGFSGVTIPAGVTKIGDRAFTGCQSFTGSLVIPTSVNNIGTSAFGACSKLNDINLSATNPSAITLGTTVFTGVPTASCVLYVPSGAKAAYSTANQWKDFTNIVDDVPVPVVATLSAASTNSTTATCKGNIVRLGSPVAAAYGMCWNTSGTPTTSNQKVNNGKATATGEFSNVLTGLSPNTTYYVRAYAQNTRGTVYGAEFNITTIAIPDAPVMGMATAGNKQASVSFTPPAATGNASQVYTVTSTPGGLTATGTASPIIISGLSNGTDYTFTVTATNSAGTSPTSAASNSVMPNLTPQTITFGTMENHSYGDAPYTLAATSTSGLPITYTSDNAAVVTVSDDVLTVVGAGTATITASQAGDATYAATTATQTITINKAPLTVSAVADTKTYDGTTASAAVPTIGALVAGDAVITAPTQSYDNASAGDAHVLSVAPLAIKNGDADVTANYAITYVPATGAINKADLTVSAVADSKTYDGTTASAAVPTIGALVAGDAVITAPIQSYDNAGAGDDHVLLVAPLAIKNGDADVTANYAITYVPATGAINKADLMVSAVADSKTYDGTTASAVVPTIGALVAGDAVITAPTQSYDHASAGDARVLSVAPLTIKNGDADVTANYAITYVSATGTINKADLTVSAVADTKTYDGTTASAAVPTIGALVAGDAVITAPTQSYDNASAGAAHVLSVAPLAIKNGDADVTANYAITYVPATGAINKADLTVSAVADTKTYDGTMASTAVPTVGALVTGDAVITAPIQSYDNAGAGDAHVLSVAPLAIKNGDADVTANYAITYVPATGAINKADLMVSAVADSKTYDGTTASAAVPTIGALVAGDAVITAPIQSYDNASAGTAHVLSVAPLAIKNGDVDVTANYAITYVPATGTINKADLTVSAVADTKTYDGTTASAAVPTIGALVAGDAVITAPTQSYDNASAGAAHVLSVAPLAIKNGDADVTANYAITYVSATGAINKADLTVSAVADTKTYDGTTTSTAVPTVGALVGGDAVSTAPLQSYDNAGAGDAHLLSVTPLTIKKGDVDVTANYAITYVSAKGTINKADLTVSAVADTKTYDGTTASTAVPTIGALAVGDVVSTTLTQSYDNASAGDAHVLSVAPLAIKNGDVDVTANYAISYVSATGVVRVKPLLITDPIVVKSKEFDNKTTAVVSEKGSLQGVVKSDEGNLVVTAQANYADATIGKGKVITVSYTLGGSAAGNYKAPADFIIIDASIYSGTIIVDNISEPTVNSQKNGFEVSYSIASGSPTEYKITYNAAAQAAGIQNISYTPLVTTGADGVLSVTLPDGVRPGKYRGTLQLKNESGVESAPYDFVITVNVSLGYLVVKYNRMLVLNNVTKQFETYQWYKDGVVIEGATKQYYRDPAGLVGAYSLKVTTVEGDTLESDIKVLNLPLAAKVSGYPSLVKANQAYTVEITDENASLNLAGAELSVYSERGLLVYKTTHVEKVNTIQLPRTQGLYTGRVLTADGDSYQFKVIVAN